MFYTVTQFLHYCFTFAAVHSTVIFYDASKTRRPDLGQTYLGRLAGKIAKLHSEIQLPGIWNNHVSRLDQCYHGRIFHAGLDSTYLHICSFLYVYDNRT